MTVCGCIANGARTAGCTLAAYPTAAGAFVEGSPVKRLNPDAWRGRGVLAALDIAVNSQKGGRRKRMAAAQGEQDGSRDDCAQLLVLGAVEAARSLFAGDMRPGKLIAIIAACERLGITHIIEEGRYGGLCLCVLTPRLQG